MYLNNLNLVETSLKTSVEKKFKGKKNPVLFLNSLNRNKFEFCNWFIRIWKKDNRPNRLCAYGSVYWVECWMSIGRLIFDALLKMDRFMKSEFILNTKWFDAKTKKHQYYTRADKRQNVWSQQIDSIGGVTAVLLYLSVCICFFLFSFLEVKRKKR